MTNLVAGLAFETIRKIKEDGDQVLVIGGSGSGLPAQLSGFGAVRFCDAVPATPTSLPESIALILFLPTVAAQDRERIIAIAAREEIQCLKPPYPIDTVVDLIRSLPRRSGGATVEPWAERASEDAESDTATDAVPHDDARQAAPTGAGGENRQLIARLRSSMDALAGLYDRLDADLKQAVAVLENQQTAADELARVTAERDQLRRRCDELERRFREAARLFGQSGEKT